MVCLILDHLQACEKVRSDFTPSLKTKAFCGTALRSAIAFLVSKILNFSNTELF